MSNRTRTRPFRLTSPEPSEHEIQRAVHKALTRLLVPPAVHFSIDHANAKDARAGFCRQLRGVVRGIPDVAILHAGGTLWVELKTATGTLSDAQRELHTKMLAAGHIVVVCRSVEETLDAVAAAGIALRGRVAA